MPARCSSRFLARSVALLGLTLGGSASAWPKLQGVAESSLGYTDNVRTTPENGEELGAARSQGVFWMLSPGVVMAVQTRRVLQRLSYRYEYDLYFAESSASSSSNRLEYRGYVDLLPRVALVLGANVNQSDRFSSVAFSAPGAGAANVLPAQGGAFLQGGADELLSFDLHPRWRAWQGASFVGDTPIFDSDGPRTLAFGGRAGVEHLFPLDAVGLEVRADYSIVKDGVLSDGTPTGRQRQLVTGAVGQWRHDWGPLITSSAEAGVVRVRRLDTGRGFWSPTGGATLAYVDEFADVQLSYAHAVTTNPLVGQSLLVDEVRLRGALPLLPQGILMAAASAGYQHGRLIAEDATLAARIDVALLDLSLAWQATKSLELGARYQHVRQSSDATRPPLPLSFIQNNVLLGATLKFPPERDMPRAYRAPRRVDRTDEIRDGFGTSADGPRVPGDIGR
jgi:hypothetical protein